MTKETDAKPTWKTEHSIEIAATPATVWEAFRDIAGWKRWNAGVEDILLEGPFAAGTWFTMKVTGQGAIRSRLLEVRENERFVDETRLDDLVVTVAHDIEALGAGRTRVTYSVTAKGPGADEVGPMVSSDFPDVLRSLARFTSKAAQ